MPSNSASSTFLSCVALFACCATALASDAPSVSGIVTDKPADGRSVAFDGGNMIAYQRRIPGTQAKFEMLPIPAGTFLLGSPENEPGRSADEGPQVEVDVQPYWIGKHEVTWSEYKPFMNLTNVFEKFNDQGLRIVNQANQVDAITSPSKLYEPSFTFETGDHPQQPAISMSQYAAKQYTKWLSLLTGEFYRLPSEAEWEYACRAGSTTAFSFGDDPEQLVQHAWYYKNAEEDYTTSKVGQFKPNGWGLHDMHGNVWEWVLDGYQDNGYGQLAKKQPPINWPTTRFPRVLRGGSWSSEDPLRCRSAARLASDDDLWRSYDPNTPQSPWWFASDEGQTVGFRIVRPLNPPPKEEWAKYWDADVEQLQKDVDRRIDKEGRGERGLVDPQLPGAIKQLRK